MIIALLELVAGSVIFVLSFVLQTLNFVIPNQVFTALSFFFQLPFYFSGLLPVQQILLAFLSYMTVWSLMYSVKLFIMVINMIPGVHIELPSHRHDFGNAQSDRMVAKERSLAGNFRKVMKGRDRIHT